jgi:hypothetical protein
MRIFIAAVALSACAAHRTPAWEQPGLPFGAVSAEILDDMVKKGDDAFALRQDPKKLDDALDNWKGALRYRPADVALLVRISRAARLQAFSLSGSEARTQADDAVSFAERALCARNPPLCQTAADHKQDPSHLFNQAELADLPALNAYAEALLNWSERAGTATFIEQHEWIVAAADRARELDHTADHGAPDRILGIVYSSLTTEYGGDLGRAEERFEAAVSSAPGYLPTRVEYAARWCVRMRDGARYRKLLQEVAAADPAALPDAAPENRAAQKRARELLTETRAW